MPRKTSDRNEAIDERRIRFNEAAARCRGKPGRRPGSAAASPAASMRPRPDAAENRAAPDDGPVRAAVASMRPRPDAAENRPPPLAPDRDLGASMRPRPDAAENLLERTAGAGAAVASMRPRPDAAENRIDCFQVSKYPIRFNEAAARCRGKPHITRIKETRDDELQ